MIRRLLLGSLLGACLLLGCSACSPHGSMGGAGGSGGTNPGEPGTGGAEPGGAGGTCFPECGGSAACGDGVVVPPEQCDDGNALPGDGCDEWCRAELDPCDRPIDLQDVARQRHDGGWSLVDVIPRGRGRLSSSCGGEDTPELVYVWTLPPGRWAFGTAYDEPAQIVTYALTSCRDSESVRGCVQRPHWATTVRHDVPTTYYFVIDGTPDTWFNFVVRPVPG